MFKLLGLWLILGFIAETQAAGADLDFYQALDRIVALDQNLEAQEALNRSDLRTFDADRKAALPALNASLVHSVHDEWTSSGMPDRDYWQAELGLNLYRFGQDASRYRLAQKSEDRYTATRTRQLLESERLAAERIFAYIFNSLDLSILQKLQGLRARLLDVASKQYGRGLLPQQEVKKVELDVRSIDLQIKRAEVLVEQSRAELRRYLGADPMRALWPIQNGQDALQVFNSARRHPLLEEAEQNLAMEEEREKILWAAQYPSLDAQVIANRSLSGQPYNRGSSEFLLSLTVPVLDRGLSRSLYQAQSERSRSASHNLEWIRQNLDVQNQTSAIALKESVSNIEVYEGLILTARQIYQDSLGRFERGLLTVNDLAVDEARFLGAERDRIQSWYSLHLSWLTVCQSSGLRLKDCQKAQGAS